MELGQSTSIEHGVAGLFATEPELFFDAQTEVRKFDQPRVITESDPIEVSKAILFAMNKEAV